MLALPTAGVNTTPVCAPTLAMPGASDVQVTCVVMSAVLASEYVPVAVKVVFVPLASETDAGVMAMLLSVAAVTVMLAELEEVMPPKAAVTVVVPIAVPTTLPVWLPTVAVNGSADVQVTFAVMSAVVPSEYVPVAIRFAVVPLGSVAPVVMAMLFSVAAVMVMSAELEEVMPLKDADTVVEPIATPATVPVWLPTVAVNGSADVQLTCVLISALLPSE